jgi:hypothetical protein
MIENVVKPALALAIPSLVGLAIAWIVGRLKKSGIEVDQAQVNRFEEAATKSLEWALTTMFEQIGKRGVEGWRDPAIHREVKARAKEYLIDHFPDAVNGQLGTTDFVKVGEAAEPMMTRLLPKVITQVAASPATPDSPGGTTAVPVIEVGNQPTA